jgi:hypothetical protein
MSEENTKDSSISKEQILLQILQEMQSNLATAINVLGGEAGETRRLVKKIESRGGAEGKIVEGVFAGEVMVGSDGEKYPVPANYASKSKLVEGDILKLTVLSDGRFVFKQISPTARRRLTGELVVDSEHDEHWVIFENEKWRVLKASVTYFKGQSGDQVSFLVPQDGPSKWAAVENILHTE